MQYAMESLRKTIHNPNPAAWKIKHTTPRRAFMVWSSEEDGDPDDYERWGLNEYDYGSYGPNTKFINGAPALGPGPPGPSGGGNFGNHNGGAVNPPPNFNPPKPAPSPGRGSAVNSPPPLVPGDMIIDPVPKAATNFQPKPVGGELKFHGRFGDQGGYYGRVQLSNCTGITGAYAIAQAQRAKAKAAACEPARKLTKALISPITRKLHKEDKPDNQEKAQFDLYAHLFF